MALNSFHLRPLDHSGANSAYEFPLLSLTLFTILISPSLDLCFGIDDLAFDAELVEGPLENWKAEPFKPVVLIMAC